MAQKKNSTENSRVSILKVIVTGILSLVVAIMGGIAIFTDATAATIISYNHTTITTKSVGVILVAISCCMLSWVFTARTPRDPWA